MKQRKLECQGYGHLYSTPIIIGILSAILIYIVIFPTLSFDIFRWVYSTIIQAFAAMIAIVGMFTIYKLQFLANKRENDVKELISLVKHCDKQRMMYENVCLERIQKSLDFINNEEAIENAERGITNDERFIKLQKQKIYKNKMDKGGTHGYGNKKIILSSEDGRKLLRLIDWEWAVGAKKRVLDRVKREKDTITYTKKTFKTPLMISGFLIGISFFLLSFSQESIVHSAYLLFLWLFAGIIGIAIYLTIILIKFILILIEI